MAEIRLSEDSRPTPLITCFHSDEECPHAFLHGQTTTEVTIHIDTLTLDPWQVTWLAEFAAIRVGGTITPLIPSLLRDRTNDVLFSLLHAFLGRTRVQTARIYNALAFHASSRRESGSVFIVRDHFKPPCLFHDELYGSTGRDALRRRIPTLASWMSDASKR